MSTAYIAMGANLASWAGPPERTLAQAARSLGALGRVTARSSLYNTVPVGLADQPRFVNAVVALETELEPVTLLKELLEIERAYGRDRSASIPNGPRTLDLDILTVGNLEIHESGLELPHPRLGERAFVLVPLDEIAPQLRIAGHGKTAAELLQALNQSQTGEANAVLRMESDQWHAATQS